MRLTISHETIAIYEGGQLTTVGTNATGPLFVRRRDP